MNGAIAFDSPADSHVASQNDEYHLYEDLAHSQRGVVVTLDLPDGELAEPAHVFVNVVIAGLVISGFRA